MELEDDALSLLPGSYFLFVLCFPIQSFPRSIRHSITAFRFVFPACSLQILPFTVKKFLKSYVIPKRLSCSTKKKKEIENKEIDTEQ